MKNLHQLGSIHLWKIYGILISIILVGIILIIIANSIQRIPVQTAAGDENAEHNWYDAWPVWVEAIGTTFLIAGSLGVIEKALLAGDTLSQIREVFCLHESTSRLGLAEVSINAGNYDYQHMIENSPTLTLVMNDGRTWVSSRVAQLQRRFKKKQFETDIFVIDPNGPFAEIIAGKTDYTREQQQNKIVEAVDRLKDEFSKLGSVGTLRIHYLKYFPTHSIVLGTDEAVFTLYGISTGRRAVPTFRVKKTDYADDIWATLVEDTKKLADESTLHFDSSKATGGASA